MTKVYKNVEYCQKNIEKEENLEFISKFLQNSTITI